MLRQSNETLIFGVKKQTRKQQQKHRMLSLSNMVSLLPLCSSIVRSSALIEMERAKCVHRSSTSFVEEGNKITQGIKRREHLCVGPEGRLCCCWHLFHALFQKKTA